MWLPVPCTGYGLAGRCPIRPFVASRPGTLYMMTVLTLLLRSDTLHVHAMHECALIIPDTNRPELSLSREPLRSDPEAKRSDEVRPSVRAAGWPSPNKASAGCRWPRCRKHPPCRGRPRCETGHVLRLGRLGDTSRGQRRSQLLCLGAAKQPLCPALATACVHAYDQVRCAAQQVVVFPT